MPLPFPDLNLAPDLAILMRRMRELCLALRDYRKTRWNRSDPFMEMLFERGEKGRWHGYTNVVIHDSTTITGDVRIGEGTFVGQQCNLDGSGGLAIGRHCSIAVGTRIFTHDAAKWAVTGGRAGLERSPVRIGDCCFLGANSVITRGVTIGDCCVVGAGAVITSDVPSNSIMAGVPARLVGRVHVNGDDARFEIDPSPKDPRP